MAQVNHPQANGKLELFLGRIRDHRSVFPSFKDSIGWHNETGIFLRGKKLKRMSQRRSEVTVMPTSKKQLEKLNKAKKAKAEELSKQAASGNESAKKKLKKLQKKIK